LLDTAVAGTTSITTDADITLTTTTGASNQARQAIILWNPASGTTTRNITAPAQSKIYTVINASGGTQSIVIRGVGPTTGVTIAKGESATVAWNGSDFVKVSSSGGAITFTDLTVTGNTILGDAAADTLTVNATSTFASPVSFQNLVRLPSTGRSAAAALTVTAPAFLYGVASTYTDTTSSGTIAAMAPFYALSAPTLSTSNVTTYSFASTLYVAGAPAAGGSATITNPYALYINSGASYLAGTLAVGGNSTFAANVTLGDAAADNITVTGTITSNLLFTDNTYDIGASGATRPRDLFLSRNLTVGGTLTLAGGVNLNGNVTIGDSSADTLTVNSTITSNLIFTDNTYDIGASGATRPRTLYLGTSLITPSITNSGLTSGRVVYTTTGGQETSSANLLYSGGDLTIFGITAGRGTNAIATNTAFGVSSLFLVTTGLDNTAIGYNAGGRVSSGNYNVFLGRDAGQYVTTGNYNIFIGVGSGTTSANPTSGITAVGSNTGKVVTGRDNTFIGANAGEALTSGNQNVFVGTYNQTLATGSGGLMTTGSANAIFGNFNGNQNSLDIRTASNWIVLSDGDGGPKFVVNGTTKNTSLPGSSSAYNSSSGTFDSTLQIGSNLQLMSFAAGANTQSQFGSNVYYDGGYRAIAGGAGSSKLFIGASGIFEFAGAASLTSAGDLISYTKTLDCGGLAFTVALQGATSVTGTGITFPPTQFASSNANTLDDYEEGTWTPTFVSAVNPTYTFTSFLATYIKIGRLVTLGLRFVVASASGGSGSVLQIGGFPFTCETGNMHSGVVGWNQTGSWSSTQPVNWEVQGGGNGAYLHGYNSSFGTVDLTPSALQAGATFEGSITYIAAS
jgi:hypothetical protein